MKNYKSKTCFIAYPWKSKTAEAVIHEVVYPTLKEMNWEIVDPRYFESTPSIYDEISKGIKSANLFICDLTFLNSAVVFELGLAHAWGIPTLIFAGDMDRIPFEMATNYKVLLYSKDTKKFSVLREELLRFLMSFEHRAPSLLDPFSKRHLDLNRIISLEIFSQSIGVEILRFTNDVLDCLGKIETLQETSLREVRIGTFGAWVATNIQTIANLIEKILFFVPEWKKKNTERGKIEAESKLLNAQAEKTNAEAEAIRQSVKREDIEMLFDLMGRGKTIGPARLTIGNRLRIECDEKGMIIIGKPVDKIDEGSRQIGSNQKDKQS